MYLTRLVTLSVLTLTTLARNLTKPSPTPKPTTLPEENANTLKFLLYNTTYCSGTNFDITVLSANQEVAA
jgi:hypothetical protein